MEKNNIADNLATIIRNMMARGYVEELPPNIHDHIMDIEDVSIRDFMQQTAILLSHLQQSQQYILELASGNLNAETENKSLLLSPFKQLQANLKHLTWQAQRLAEGDLNQHIDFMGDFSTYFNQLIQSLKEKRVVENALKYSNENYKISFENANIGIMTVNFDGIIISANKECEKIFGYSRDELEGINVNAYSFTTDLSLSREFIDSALRMPEHGKQVFIKRFYHKSGRIITCEISSSLLVDLSGNPIHFVSHIKDITLQMEMEQKQRQLNTELEEKVRKLKETNDARDKFMSIIAHDLKNPFNVILGFSSFLSNHLEELSSDEIKTYTSNIHQATFSTFQLLQTLLEWANAQRGRMIFNPETIEAGSIMDEVIATVHNNAAAKNITISYDKDSVIKVNADHNMLSTILRNIISNSIKFTPENGSISIETSLHKSHVTFAIKDTGIGMDRETVNKLFKVDEKVSMPGTNMETGSGLGLLLCKEFVDKHCGSITVDSIPGKGSTFVIELPAANRA